MNQRIWTCLLALLFLLSPLSAFALGETTDDAVVVAAADTGVLSESEPVSQTPRVTVTYDPEQQKTPDDLPAIACKAAFIADPASGKVFFEKRAL